MRATKLTEREKQLLSGRTMSQKDEEIKIYNTLLSIGFGVEDAEALSRWDRVTAYEILQNEKIKIEL